MTPSDQDYSHRGRRGQRRSGVISDTCSFYPPPPLQAEVQKEVLRRNLRDFPRKWSFSGVVCDVLERYFAAQGEEGDGASGMGSAQPVEDWAPVQSGQE